ncbi:MAG: PhoH family protein [Woeseiaceae bacterium]
MKPRLFVLDTNVLMHDPSSIFRFHEHNLFLPMMVLEELDNNKKGRTEVARNARQASRFIAELMVDATKEQIEAGIPLSSALNDEDGKISSGKLFFQTRSYKKSLPDFLPGSLPDNNILGTTLALIEELKDYDISLVTKDINFRIKAAALGIKVEDYHNDRALEDVDLLYTGTIKLKEDFWDTHAREMDSWLEEGRTFYKLHGPEVENWHPNAFIVSQDEDQPFEALVRSIDGDTAIIETIKDFQSNSNSVWGINARNQEQNDALNLLMDPEIDFVSLIGMAGTGKTLLTLAAGLEQTIEQQLYSEILMTRVTVPVGEDIGFLPGTEEEKMTPWMGALMDNLEVLNKKEDKEKDSSYSSEWGQAVTNDLIANRIKIRSINFMRGRTFLNRYLIIDEAQNLTSHQLKTLITRAGPGTKIVCLGNIAQIDTPYLTETTSGLTYVIDRFKHWDHSGHITLIRGERSRLADFASEAL